jgi:hypothetical protein
MLLPVPLDKDLSLSICIDSSICVLCMFLPVFEMMRSRSRLISLSCLPQGTGLRAVLRSECIKKRLLVSARASLFLMKLGRRPHAHARPSYIHTLIRVACIQGPKRTSLR